MKKFITISEHSASPPASPLISPRTPTHKNSRERTKIKLSPPPRPRFKWPTASEMDTQNSPPPLVKTARESIKKHINQRNVRRKSSTANASCFKSIHDKNVGTSPLTNKIDERLLTKAAKRGSIHLASKQPLINLLGRKCGNFDSPTQSATVASQRKKALLVDDESIDSLLAENEFANWDEFDEPSTSASLYLNISVGQRSMTGCLSHAISSLVRK